MNTLQRWISFFKRRSHSFQQQALPKTYVFPNFYFMRFTVYTGQYSMNMCLDKRRLFTPYFSNRKIVALWRKYDLIEFCERKLWQDDNFLFSPRWSSSGNEKLIDKIFSVFFPSLIFCQLQPEPLYFSLAIQSSKNVLPSVTHSNFSLSAHLIHKIVVWKSIWQQSKKSTWWWYVMYSSRNLLWSWPRSTTLDRGHCLLHHKTNIVNIEVCLRFHCNGWGKRLLLPTFGGYCTCTRFLEEALQSFLVKSAFLCDEALMPNREPSGTHVPAITDRSRTLNDDGSAWEPSSGSRSLWAEI